MRSLFIVCKTVQTDAVQEWLRFKIVTVLADAPQPSSLRWASSSTRPTGANETDRATRVLVRDRAQWRRTEKAATLLPLSLPSRRSLVLRSAPCLTVPRASTATGSSGVAKTTTPTTHGSTVTHCYLHTTAPARLSSRRLASSTPQHGPRSSSCRCASGGTRTSRGSCGLMCASHR